MGVTLWDRLSAWKKEKLEPGFEEGASIQIELHTGEVIPGEVRVFRANGDATDQDLPQTGIRALINGQSHARRDAGFFRSSKVELEHIAGSMLVTLDCTSLGQDSRNNLFMSNRETFREDTLLPDLLKRLQKELRDHEGLQAANQRRYEQKISAATSDDDGVNALEELLSTDPALAELFGSSSPGKVAAKTLNAVAGPNVEGDPIPFEGTEFPSYFKRKSGALGVLIKLPRGGDKRVRFITDVQNNYFSRPKFAGKCAFTGDLQPSLHLFNGRLTFTFHGDKKFVEGTTLQTNVEIWDEAGHGPFKLFVQAVIVAPVEKTTHQPPSKPPKIDSAPSRPEIKEYDGPPDAPPLEVDRPPKSQQLVLRLNRGSQLLIDAKKLRPPEESGAVEFVFKYGLALVAMGLLEKVRNTQEWFDDEVGCRKKIDESAAGVGRVIVPLCLTLPKKLPKAA